MKRHSTRGSPSRSAWLGMLALILFSGFSLAGTIQKAEVRIDGGPAAAMNLVSTQPRPAFWEGNYSLQLSTASLSLGSHWVEARFQGDNGVWCAWQGQWIRVVGQPRLTGAEWFVDADPGPGRGTPIPAPKDGVWDEAEEAMLAARVPMPNLAVGRHTLYLRAQDAHGDWGLPNQTIFYVGEPMRLVAAEWTTDPQAAPGTGFPVLAADGAFDGPLEDLYAEATADQVGLLCSIHSIYVRVQDNLGRWSTRRGLYWTPAAGEPGGLWRLDPALGWVNAVVEDLPVVPGIPAQPAPAHNSTWSQANLSVTLRWSSCPGAENYEVFFWRQGKSKASYRLQGTANTTLTVPIPEIGLESWPGSPFYWEVHALARAGCASVGPTWFFRVPGPGDADGDGMPDEWERQQFVSARNADPLSDADNDGYLDWQEFVAGTNPNGAQDYFKIGTLLLVPDLLKISWPAIPDRIYTVYGTTDLAQDWVQLYQTTNSLQSAETTLSYTNATFVDDQWFLRIGVELTK